MHDPAAPATSRSAAPRDVIYWSLLLSVLCADIVTKQWAERALALHAPVEVVGSWVRWTLTYNTGAALNLSLGDASRLAFSSVAILMLGYLFVLYRRADPTDRAGPAAFALLSAGALGNLLDRLRHAKGVVDFIDVGTADWRFWTFNVADVGVTAGAVLLATLMWREGASTRDQSPHASTLPTSDHHR